jgi:hypothetical protein
MGSITRNIRWAISEHFLAALNLAGFVRDVALVRMLQPRVEVVGQRDFLRRTQGL